MSGEDTRHRIDSTLLHLYREVATTSTMVKDIAERLEAVELKVDTIAEDLARYRGICRGIFWLGGILWAGFTVFKDWWR